MNWLFVIVAITGALALLSLAIAPPASATILCIAGYKPIMTPGTERCIIDQGQPFPIVVPPPR